MKKILLILLTLMFIGCENSSITSVDIECSQNEDGVEECIAGCSEGYYLQENEDELYKHKQYNYVLNLVKQHINNIYQTIYLIRSRIGMSIWRL